MKRRPYVPYPVGLGETIFPRDPRTPAMKARCKRAVENLVEAASPRLRGPTAAAWALLEALALAGARRAKAWNGRRLAEEVLGGVVIELGRQGEGSAFRAPEGAAPPVALKAAEGLFDHISTTWPLGHFPPGKLAWALLMGTLEEARMRFGPDAAAQLGALALLEIAPLHVSAAAPAGTLET